MRVYIALLCVAACGGETVPDAGVDASDGGFFLCGSSNCDGRTHYCDISCSVSCGDFPPVCKPLPDACAAASCTCLVEAGLNPQCKCELDDSGVGLMAGCRLP
jgi:hypothetical protein